MRRITLAVVVVALLVAAVGAALYTGAGPAPGGNDDRDRLTDYPTGTPLGTSVSSGASTGTASPVAPFAFTIESIEECGRTCRDVSVSLVNNQDEAATDLTVYTRIYAGQDTTASEDRVWEGKEAVGDLPAGGTHTATRRVELSLQEALQIENNGGWVTIVTTVQTSERTVTFRDVEQVA